MSRQPRSPLFTPLSLAGQANRKSSISASVEVAHQDRFIAGEGYSITQGEPKPRALEAFSIAPDGQKNTLLKNSSIFGYEEIIQALEVKISGEALYEGVEASGALEYLNYIEGSANTITLVYACLVERSAYSLAPLDDYKVTPEALQFFRDQGQDAFAERYGQYFVAGHKFGSLFYAVYRCSSKNASRFDQFKLKLGASVDDLFQADAAIEFKRLANEYGVSLNIEVKMTGVDGNKRPPNYDKSDPSEVLELLNWFKDNEAGTEVQTLLRSYAYVIPEFKDEVDIPPALLNRLREMYQEFSYLTLLYQSLPENYKKEERSTFNNIRNQVAHGHKTFVEDPEELDAVYAQILAESVVLQNILERQNAYADVQVSLANRPEPATDVERSGDSAMDAYGLRYLPEEIAGDLVTLNYYITHTADINAVVTKSFNYEDKSAYILGWEVRSHWNDWNGDWEKTSTEAACLNDRMSLEFSTDVWRGMSYNVVLYTVPKVLYQFA